VPLADMTRAYYAEFQFAHCAKLQQTGLNGEGSPETIGNLKASQKTAENARFCSIQCPMKADQMAFLSKPETQPSKTTVLPG
jgi:hypothetical protein